MTTSIISDASEVSGTAIIISREDNIYDCFWESLSASWFLTNKLTLIVSSKKIDGQHLAIVVRGRANELSTIPDAYTVIYSNDNITFADSSKETSWTSSLITGVGSGKYYICFKIIINGNKTTAKNQEVSWKIKELEK
ncbi:hypothetical protein HCN44_002104 [Aphidius gifuensis]|uniref:Uncharacterized protein n=1 Tax=Aphidius gifuensis TaxID=684658 RepID=A0A834Y474_APHGI|nr:hypothetical protein HCN44_002104 [Aphidius gifuensis]